MLSYKRKLQIFLLGETASTQPPVSVRGQEVRRGAGPVVSRAADVKPGAERGRGQPRGGARGQTRGGVRGRGDRADRLSGAQMRQKFGNNTNGVRGRGKGKRWNLDMQDFLVINAKL